MRFALMCVAIAALMACNPPSPSSGPPQIVHDTVFMHDTAPARVDTLPARTDSIKVPVPGPERVVYRDTGSTVYRDTGRVVVRIDSMALLTTRASLDSTAARYSLLNTQYQQLLAAAPKRDTILIPGPTQYVHDTLPPRYVHDTLPPRYVHDTVTIAVASQLDSLWRANYALPSSDSNYGILCDSAVVVHRTASGEYYTLHTMGLPAGAVDTNYVKSAPQLQSAGRPSAVTAVVVQGANPDRMQIAYLPGDTEVLRNRCYSAPATSFTWLRTRPGAGSPSKSLP